MKNLFKKKTGKTRLRKTRQRWEDYQDDEYYGEDDYEEGDYEDSDEYYEDDEYYVGDEDAGRCEDEEYDAEDAKPYEEDEGEEYYGDDSEEYYGDDSDEYYEGEDEEYYGDDSEEYYEGEDEEYYEDDSDEYYEGEDEEYYGDDSEEYYEDDAEEYYEDDSDEYYEEDDDDYEDDGRHSYVASHRRNPRGIKGVIRWFTGLNTTDHVIMFTGIVVVVLLVVTGTLYANAKGRQKQVETFAEVGVGLEDIPVIGEEGLLAIADAQAARLMAAVEQEQIEEQEQEEEETKAEGQEVHIFMSITSIQRDMKIKFTNEATGKLFSGVEFEVNIKNSSGGELNKKDEDKDGVIYLTGMKSGKYTVTLISPLQYEEYVLSSDPVTITVKEDIEYKKVDVADEIKTESQVNVAQEDTKVNETVVESTNTDTVEWVESTKTLIEGTEKNEDSYEAVDKKLIADPGKSASLFLSHSMLTDIFFYENPVYMGEIKTQEVPQEGEGTPEPTTEPEKTPEPVPTGEPTETPTPEPTEPPRETEEPVPTKEPVQTPTPTVEPTQTPAPTASPTQTPTVAPTASPTISPSASPSVLPSLSPSVSPSVSPSPSISKEEQAKNDTTTTLKATDGKVIYVKDADGSFREAKYADYYTQKEFYLKTSKTTGEYRYTGWQTIDGRTYFFDKNGNKVTGEQVIQGAKYNFNSDGSLNSGSGHMGIDVSKWNGNIDWNAVKNSGVSYVIIRCGYRGSTTGALIEDPKFRSNIQGAQKAGLKVGVYFFTQAVNEVEAVEEASMVISLVKGYNISYPVFLDVEASNGRGDQIDASTRTAVCRAFCQTIQNSGYKAGIYANKTWLNSYLDAPGLSSYKIWLAQYAASPSYTRTRYDMWQYSSKGSVAGISGNVDMNISYLGY